MRGPSALPWRPPGWPAEAEEVLSVKWAWPRVAVRVIDGAAEMERQGPLIPSLYVPMSSRQGV